MRRAEVRLHGVQAGLFEELEPGRGYRFSYAAEYRGSPISLTMPLSERVYEYDAFPPFFDGNGSYHAKLDGVEGPDLVFKLFGVGVVDSDRNVRCRRVDTPVERESTTVVIGVYVHERRSVEGRTGDTTD